MTEVYLALGSNMGNSAANIAKATTLMATKIHHIERAGLYQTKPMGYTAQPDFLNTAISGQTELGPKELLTFVKDVEQRVGRVARFRWGPREIDIDIIFYGDHVINQPGLRVPHPRFAERDFVLRPLSDLNSQLVDPLSQRTIAWLTQKSKSSTITPYAEV